MRSEKNQRYAPRLVDKTEVEILNSVRDSAATERRLQCYFGIWVRVVKPGGRTFR